ncbi:MAG: contractile injection system protein, VgrG/Pvc8 family [Myxococcota bacterium]|nr:contractile injection system protein, VgrG/Pvc8 family [Myxococcota bacterium]
MPDDRDPHDVPAPHHPDAPDADHSGEDVQEGLEVAQEVIERVVQVAQGASDLAEGGAADPSVGEALGGTLEGLGAVDQIAGLADADPAIRQVLGVAQQAVAIAASAYEAGEALVEAGESIIEAITGEADQSRVEYDFECAAERDAGWRVREVEIDEQLGAPYRIRLSLITEDVDALPANLLGQDCRLRISRGDETSRSVHGLVSRVDHGQRSDRHLVTSIEIVPALDVLRHVEDSRIFQSLTALEIIDAFLGQYLSEYGRTLRLEANATYVQREYCVQYRETALDFFHRLCEEEGLTYFFDQSGEKEELVVIDDNASFAPSFLLPTASDVPFVAHRGGDIAGAEPAYHFAASDRLGPTSHQPHGRRLRLDLSHTPLLRRAAQS